MKAQPCFKIQHASQQLFKASNWQKWQKICETPATMYLTCRWAGTAALY